MDTDQIKKVSTFKSGNFIFSRQHQDPEIETLHVWGMVFYKTVSDLPILPAWSSQLEETLIRRSIFGTAALEGNPLKEEEVGRIIGDTGQPQKSARAEQEIRNLKAAYQFIRELSPASTPPVIDEALIKKVHALVTAKIEHPDNVPGLYRNHKVQVGDKDHGGVYTPPKCLPDIEKLMQEFILWINSDQMLATNPYFRAALAHYHLGLIHPFSDGNGRVARIIEALLLRLSGQKYVPTMLSNYYYRNMDEYFRAFSSTRKDKESDVSLFIKFVLKGVIDSLEEIKNRITYFIRRLALRDHYAALHREKAIIQRQHDLLTMLLQLQDAKPFSLQDLFNTPSMNTLYRNVSERTARRDLKKLLEMNLLTCVDDQHTLNIEALG
jgi:Fic family protein